MIFLLELFLRIFVEGRRFVRDVANLLDTVLVIGGLVDIMVSMQLDSSSHLLNL